MIQSIMGICQLKLGLILLDVGVKVSAHLFSAQVHLHKLVQQMQDIVEWNDIEVNL